MKRKCPKDSALVALFMNELAPRESDRALRHLAACPRCSFRFNVLRQVKRDLEPKVESFAAAHAPADAAALLQGAARDGIAALGPAVPARPSPAPSRSRPFGVFFGLRFAAGLLALLAVLTAGAFFALTRFHTHAVLRSPSLTLTLLAPVGTISAVPGVFRWTPVLNAESYYLELIDDSLNLVYQGSAFLITETLLPAPVRSGLAKGRTYVWSVAARDAYGSYITTRSGSFVIE